MCHTCHVIPVVLSSIKFNEYNVRYESNLMQLFIGLDTGTCYDYNYYLIL